MNELFAFFSRSRLKKNKYFIFQNIAGQVIVFMPAEFESEMVMVDEEHPLNADGQALQVVRLGWFSANMNDNIYTNMFFVGNFRFIKLLLKCPKKMSTNANLKLV